MWGDVTIVTMGMCIHTVCKHVSQATVASCVVLLLSSGSVSLCLVTKFVTVTVFGYAGSLPLVVIVHCGCTRLFTKSAQILCRVWPGGLPILVTVCAQG